MSSLFFSSSHHSFLSVRFFHKSEFFLTEKQCTAFWPENDKKRQKKTFFVTFFSVPYRAAFQTYTQKPFDTDEEKDFERPSVINGDRRD